MDLSGIKQMGQSEGFLCSAYKYAVNNMHVISSLNNLVAILLLQHYMLALILLTCIVLVMKHFTKVMQ